MDRMIVGVVGVGWCAVTAFAAPQRPTNPAQRVPSRPTSARQVSVPTPQPGKAAQPLAVEAQAVLVEHCVSCHGPQVQQGGLRLDRRESLLKPMSNGRAALVPGDVKKSPLLEVLSHTGKIKMPPQGKLPPEAIATLTRWVEAGVPWPEKPAGKTATAPGSQPSLPSQHWAFQPLRRPSLPRVTNTTWSRTPVDRFILAALEQKRLTPTAPADRRKLLRRLTFDLTGLPPTPEELEKFLQDPDPKAYEKQVDRLLASPRYGERWGRHWLDLARYADSDGQEGDEDRPNAYHYRDFVIRALNQDLPYHTFVRWQLAGDEIEPDNPLAVSATGFLAAGTHAALPANLLEEERIRERYNELDDVLSTTGAVFLGLTLGCARCHDHKYDPIPTKDYYRLLAAFNAGDRAEVPLLPRAEVQARRKVEQEWQGRMDAAKKAGNPDEIKALEASKPPAMPAALAVADFGAKPRENWLLDRGDFRRRKEPVELGFLSVLCRDESPAAYWSQARAHGTRNDTTYQRRALADWMTDTEHGAGALLARVLVNRLWQGHFGEGLVRTVNDFGKRSEAPTHPALLEWLASDLVRSGWRLKPLHRVMVLSAAYRQGTAFTPKAAKIDPENRLLWHHKLHRVEAEVFRDSMLAVAGTLNLQMYGSGFKPPIQPEAIQARNLQSAYPADAQDTPETRRRTVYMFHKRVVQYPLLQAFDGPDAAAACGRRNVTTVAPQALAVLNEPFIRLRALEFAARLQKDAGAAPADQVKRAYRLAFGRTPTVKELEASVRFLQEQTVSHAARKPNVEPSTLALADFAQVLFGLNEFLYVD